MLTWVSSLGSVLSWRWVHTHCRSLTSGSLCFRSLAWYSVWSSAVRYETLEMWYDSTTSTQKPQPGILLLHVTVAVFQLILTIQSTLGSKRICCLLYICTCVYVWLLPICPLSEFLCVLTECLFTCDLSVSGICITHNKICLLGISDSCYLRRITFLTSREKKSKKSLEKLLIVGYSKKVDNTSASQIIAIGG